MAMARVNKAALRHEFTENYVRDWWLIKYHNTNCEQVKEKYPTESLTGEWYKLFKVTQEQHDEWYEWFITETAYRWGWSRKMAEHQTAFTYLNVAPDVKRGKGERA